MNAELVNDKDKIDVELEEELFHSTTHEKITGTLH